MSYDDLSIKQLRRAVEIMMTMSTTATEHALEHMDEPDHECDWDMSEMDGEDIPSFDDFDVKVFLAFEDAFVTQAKFLRAVLREQGYALTKERT